MLRLFKRTLLRIYSWKAGEKEIDLQNQFYFDVNALFASRLNEKNEKKERNQAVMKRSIVFILKRTDLSFAMRTDNYLLH